MYQPICFSLERGEDSTRVIEKGKPIYISYGAPMRATIQENGSGELPFKK